MKRKKKLTLISPKWQVMKERICETTIRKLDEGKKRKKKCEENDDEDISSSPIRFVG